jgi:hypothetical protein
VAAPQTSASAAYERIRAGGAEAWADRGKLFLHGAPAVLESGELVDLARAHRAELVAALRFVRVCTECRAAATVLLVMTTRSGAEQPICARCARAESPSASAIDVEIRPRRTR